MTINEVLASVSDKLAKAKKNNEQVKQSADNIKKLCEGLLGQGK